MDARELARWRTERKQSEAANRVQQIQQEYAQAERERDIAIANNDIETAEWRDMDCEQLEQEYRQYVPPPKPKMHPAAQEWILQNKPFFDRHGTQADQAVKAAHAWLTRPGNAGWKVNSPEYFGAIESLLETDGQRLYGVRYDPAEKVPNLREAAKITGMSPNKYVGVAQELYKQGRVGRDS
jgi:hypothetical protein